MLCPCGRQLNITGSPYQFRKFNDKAEVVYAICVHGHTVVDIEEIDIHKLIKDADLRGELDEPIDS